ncbi:MAG: hypothetical protein QOD30_947 [Actinomycetota bacterium]|nr:hypothetical protein [Actinomycetota bacterium]
MRNHANGGPNPTKKRKIRNFKPVMLWEAHPTPEVEIQIDRSPVDGSVWLYIGNPATEDSDGWQHPDEDAAKKDALRRTGLSAIAWRRPTR